MVLVACSSANPASSSGTALLVSVLSPYKAARLQHTSPTFEPAPSSPGSIVGHSPWHSQRTHEAELDLLCMQLDSHEKSLARGQHELQMLVDRLQMKPREACSSAGLRLYKLALQRNFTRGRRTGQVLYSLGKPDTMVHGSLTVHHCRVWEVPQGQQSSSATSPAGALHWPGAARPGLALPPDPCAAACGS